MNYCGISSGEHSTMGNVVLFEYTKEILREGMMPAINVTVQEDVPPELLEKMSKQILFLFHFRNNGN